MDYTIEKCFHVVCCFKIVEDIDTMTKLEYEQLEQGISELSYIKRMLNCFDEAALENALRLKDEGLKQGICVKITAITINPGYSDHIIKNFPAIGIDETIVLDADSLDLRFQPEITAEILKDAMKNLTPFHLVLTGKQAPPLNSGLVPLFLAEELNIPCITDVTEFGFSEGGLYMERFTGKSTEKMLIDCPVLVSIGNSKHSYIRVPTLKDKLKTKKWKPIVETVDVERWSTNWNFILRNVADEREGKELSGEQLEEKADALADILNSGGGIV